MYLCSARLWLMTCMLVLLSFTCAASAERTCIDSLRGRFVVGVEEDGVTWRIADANKKSLGKILLTCRVDPARSGGVAVFLAGGGKVCLGMNLVDLDDANKTCIVQELQISSTSPESVSKDELPGFAPSELNTKLAKSGHWFWLVGYFVSGSYTYHQGHPPEFSLTDAHTQVHVIYHNVFQFSVLTRPLFEDGQCVAIFRVARVPGCIFRRLLKYRGNELSPRDHCVIRAKVGLPRVLRPLGSSKFEAPSSTIGCSTFAERDRLSRTPLIIS